MEKTFSLDGIGNQIDQQFSWNSFNRNDHFRKSGLEEMDRHVELGGFPQNEVDRNERMWAQKVKNERITVERW